MLVIISDLHLTDGTACRTLDSGAFRIFAERLQDLAVRASWRSDETYRPIDKIDVVLLGDVLDLIRSNLWHKDQTRPWDSINSVELSNRVAEITGRTLANNAESLAVLKAMANNGVIQIPQASNSGYPNYETSMFEVPVHMHYMVGNHDWFLHLQGTEYDLIRKHVADAMGLVTDSNRPFPHDPDECPLLRNALTNHRVCARHGDIYDPINFSGNRDESSLGDAIVLELVNRFVADVQHRFGNELPHATLSGLQQIDHIRPLLLIPTWIDGLLQRTCPQRSLHREIKSIWDAAADRFLELPIVRQQDSWHPFEVVDGLEQLLKFSRSLSISWSSRITEWLYSIRGAKSASYVKHALAEPDFRNRRAKHVVYGHTHSQETVALDASFADGLMLSQTYFNSGTWRRVHLPTELAPDGQEFLPSEMMSYLTFFQADERQGRSYEIWSGMLGAMPSPVRRVRLDNAQNVLSTKKPAQTPKNSPLKQPHFLSPTPLHGIPQLPQGQ